MRFAVQSSVNNFIILGAGASVDYGLPTWNQLSDLIKQRISADKDNFYSYKKEILEWLEKVGQDKKHKTIDECITTESNSREYHDNGADIENEIFRLFQDGFNAKYCPNPDGWISKLNTFILENSKLVGKIAFINHNYDDVLGKNLLDFSYLSSKRRLIYSKQLLNLSEVYIPTLYAHGFLGEDYGAHVAGEGNTIKTDHTHFLDAVSCHDSERHEVITYSSDNPVNLFILGLGGGMEINLNKINFINPIGEIYVTVTDAANKDKVASYLSERFSKSKENINMYVTCDDLVDKCFST